MNLAAPSITATFDAAAPRKPAMPAGASGAEALRVGREFESLFLSQMLGHIFEQMPTNGPFGGGNGEKLFRSLQVDEYAKAVARKGGVGIAEAVQREILKMQEKSHG
ncbi:MAG: rod-binding protein [Rhodospirillales bacterium]|nr:rod-binding protein [Rhodospirillales bacterium]